MRVMGQLPFFMSYVYDVVYYRLRGRADKKGKTNKHLGLISV